MATPKTRGSLQTLLETLIGNRNVYFQPPPSIRMKYPAIVYSVANIQNNPANNSVYGQDMAYQLTIIDEDPESEVSKKVSILPMCRFNRSFKSDNLNHFVYTLYYGRTYS